MNMISSTIPFRRHLATHTHSLRNVIRNSYLVLLKLTKGVRQSRDDLDIRTVFDTGRKALRPVSVAAMA